MTAIKALDAEKLSRRCDPESFSFATTAELEDPDEVLGQKRALEAIRFAIGMKPDGYNLFALGPSGLGKHAVVRHVIEARAAEAETPPDWCYVFNFDNSQKPRALRLPVGLGGKLQADMTRLLQSLHVVIPAAFKSDEYRSQRNTIEADVKQRHEQVIAKIQQEARERGVALLRTPAGLGFAAMQDGEVLEPEAFEALPEADRSRIQETINSLQGLLQAALRELSGLVSNGRQRVRELNRDVTRYAAGHLIDEMRDTYEGVDDVIGYLDAVRKDVVENDETFAPSDVIMTSAPSSGEAPTPATQLQPQEAGVERYGVNVLVDSAGLKGAPVIYEDHPTYQRLVGEIEQVARMGALVTDFTLIKSGALHRANGGYLILDGRKLLQQPLAYDALKQALRSRRIRIETFAQANSMVHTRGLEPEPIPLDVKVIIIGEPSLYYQLTQSDPDFSELFKVAADFEDRVEHTRDNALRYAQMIAQMAREAGLKPLDRGAVARVIEHGGRLAGDAERLSVRIEGLADLLREADYWRAETGAALITADHVQQALDAQIRRANRLQERLEEEVIRGNILIDTDGAKTGQVNGLAVSQLGHFAFGKASRITARVRLGKGEVIDIEREVDLGGSLHSKGVLILAGYLGSHFATDQPLSLSASLVFEQSYGGVDGDSASSTELYAILSALAEASIKQGLAVTGSVNQFGEIQAIGGVNEKIEGFFDLCRQRGLTGDQGVLIPAANVKNLMLRSDIVEAARDGRFHVYPIAHIDQGIEILTGTVAGARDKNGNFPKNTINANVEYRLSTFAKQARRFSSPIEQ